MTEATTNGKEPANCRHSISDHDLQSVVEQIMNSGQEDGSDDDVMSVGVPHLPLTGPTLTNSHSGARPKTSVSARPVSISDGRPLGEVPLVTSPVEHVEGGRERLKSWRDAGLALKQALTRLQKSSDSTSTPASKRNEEDVGRHSQNDASVSHMPGKSDVIRQDQPTDGDPMNQMLADYKCSPCGAVANTHDGSAPTITNSYCPMPKLSSRTAQASSRTQHASMSSKLYKPCKLRDKAASQAEPSLSELTQNLKARLQQINASVSLGVSPCRKRGRVQSAQPAAETSSSECDTRLGIRHRPHSRHKATNKRDKSSPSVSPRSSTNVDSLTDNALSTDQSSHHGQSSHKSKVSATIHQPLAPATTGTGGQGTDILAPILASFRFSSSETEDGDAPSGQQQQVTGSPRRKCRPPSARVRRKSTEKPSVTQPHNSVPTRHGNNSESDSADCTASGGLTVDWRPGGSLAQTDSLSNLADIESMYEEENDASLQYYSQEVEPCNHGDQVPEKETAFEKSAGAPIRSLSQNSLPSLCSSSSQTDESTPEVIHHAIRKRNSESTPTGWLMSSDSEPELPEGLGVGSPGADTGEVPGDLASHLCVEKYRKDKANRRLKLQSVEDEEVDDDAGLESLDDWDLDWTPLVPDDQDHDKPDIKITEAELNTLPELDSESPQSSNEDVDADDEFECDCAMCRLERTAHRESSWITEEEEELIGQQEPYNVEYYADMRDGYDDPFNLSLDDLQVHSLLQQEIGSDILEFMFQNVIGQMLAVYPDLLTDGAPPPLSQTEIDNMPTLKIGVDNTGEETTCPICLCNFEDSEEVKQLVCQHIFHTLCVQAWLHKSGTCPVCRRVLRT